MFRCCCWFLFSETRMLVHSFPGRCFLDFFIKWSLVIGTFAGRCSFFLSVNRNLTYYGMVLCSVVDPDPIGSELLALADSYPGQEKFRIRIRNKMEWRLYWSFSLIFSVSLFSQHNSRVGACPVFCYAFVFMLRCIFLIGKSHQWDDNFLLLQT